MEPHINGRLAWLNWPMTFHVSGTVTFGGPCTGMLFTVAMTSSKLEKARKHTSIYIYIYEISNKYDASSVLVEMVELK